MSTRSSGTGTRGEAGIEPRGTSTLPVGREVKLEDRYLLDEGAVLLSGVQAIIRLLFDQMRADQRAGLKTGTMVSGYPGSPLGGFDMELARQRRMFADVDLVHRPAVNEELGATSVWATQLVPSMRDSRVDGVLGVWYGKAPGVDRCGDSLRHGNFVGAHPNGGMLALCGDDPQCKSSTVPSASETLLAAMRMPVIVPGNPQEAVDLGRHAVALSRNSGIWAALKIVTNLADAVSSVQVGPDRVVPRMVTVEDNGRPYVHAPTGNIAPPASVEMERTLVGPRMAIARAYARENNLNTVTVDPPHARLGLVAAGTTYYDLREALLTLGLDDDALLARGVRVLKLGMIWPLEDGIVKRFADGLEEIVVVEEKGTFVEAQIRDVLYNQRERPAVLGKQDADGSALIGNFGALDPDAIARAVALPLQRHGAGETMRNRLVTLGRPLPQIASGAPLRTPYFCSGCPHNRSTEVPDGANVGVGIGCHTMIALSPEGKGNLTGIVQMGGEGAQWIGQSPFLESDHLFQNIGDGTFHHSGSLALRASVAAGVNVTYKLLYNNAAAMTGGQEVQGALAVPELTRLLEAEGVRKIIVTTEDVGRYRGVKLASIADVRPRSELIPAQEELSKIEGVTALIHDQGCAAEKRRLRKRGKLVDPPERAFINQRVCEGCGDCGRKSHCLSVLPVETEFGSKTQIHQSSCNKDYSCLDGDCPSFLEIVPGKKAKHGVPAPPPDLPEPASVLAGDDVTLRLIGIGGTGVVTVAQILGMAALLDGKRTVGLDQTGLAQKGGPVVSDVRILAGDDERSSRPADGGVDAYLGFDLIGAVSVNNLRSADPARTIAVLSTSQVPTGGMVGHPEAQFADLDTALAAVERVTRAGDNVYLDAQALSETLFGDHMPANTLLIGAAWQRGLIPISLRALREAYTLNGAAVEKNLAAFEWGRATVADPDAVAAISSPELPATRAAAPERALLDGIGAEPGSELRRLLDVRVPELVAYQNLRYAKRYSQFVARVLKADRVAGGDGRVTEAVARNLYKLMAYKDEYEVARLHLDPVEQARITAEFGEEARVRYVLHPPALRALGMKRKIKLGTWFEPALRGLRSARAVRGTPLDVFGYAEVRRVERELPGEYRSLVERALPALESDYDGVVRLCQLPDMIRGYEDIKLANVTEFRRDSKSLAAELERSPRRHI